MCTYEADLAEDGVDGLGIPFALPSSDVVVPQPASQTDVRVLFGVVARRS